MEKCKDEVWKMGWDDTHCPAAGIKKPAAGLLFYKLFR